MIDLLKKNKLIAGVLGVLVVLILTTSLLKHAPVQKNNEGSDPKNQTNTEDAASGDDTAESLNALTQELHQVMSSNKDLQANNAALNTKNDEILRNIKSEVQQNLESELQKRGQDDQAKISTLQDQLQRVNEAIRQQSESESMGGSDQGGNELKLNGQNLVSVPDIAGGPSSIGAGQRILTGPRQHNSNTSGASSSDLLLDHADSSNGSASSDSSDHTNLKPYYTIPSGSTLAGSVTMTSLIGRVPVDGSVKAPYPFKMIIGANDMAANGLTIPGISGAIVQGYTVGDMALSCVKGYVTAITFLFPDGTISTTQMDNASSGSGDDIGFSSALGYLSTPNGNPCFPGKFYTNAPQYLTTMIALGALNQGGQAYAMAQQTSSENALGGATTALTGSVGKYMLGGAVQGGTQQAMDWYTAREKNSFDAVYVPSGQKAVINITQQILINYDPAGRKIAYQNASAPFSNTSMD
mgnify:CR=1 FL=1